jgi:hypothetical protein
LPETITRKYLSNVAEAISILGRNLVFFECMQGHTLHHLHRYLIPFLMFHSFKIWNWWEYQWVVLSITLSLVYNDLNNDQEKRVWYTTSANDLHQNCCLLFLLDSSYSPTKQNNELKQTITQSFQAPWFYHLLTMSFL